MAASDLTRTAEASLSVTGLRAKPDWKYGGRESCGPRRRRHRSHLIYEGLSRVAADAVLAGAADSDRQVLFSVWRPELVALRETLGLPRHRPRLRHERRTSGFRRNTACSMSPACRSPSAGRQACDRRASDLATAVDPAGACRKSDPLRHPPTAAHGIRRISSRGRSFRGVRLDRCRRRAGSHLTTSSKDAGSLARRSTSAGAAFAPTDRSQTIRSGRQHQSS
jgi:hypothetical protein